MKHGVDNKIVIFLSLVGCPEDALLPFIERLDLVGLELLFEVELCERKRRGEYYEL
jgi:hypothetical protein